MATWENRAVGKTWKGGFVGRTVGPPEGSKWAPQLALRLLADTRPIDDAAHSVGPLSYRRWGETASPSACGDRRPGPNANLCWLSGYLISDFSWTPILAKFFFPVRGIPSNHIQSTRMLENIYKRSSKQHETRYFQHHLRQGRWKPSRDGRDLSRNHATTLRAGAGRELGFVTRRVGPNFDELSWIIMNYCGLLWFRMF